MNAREDKQPACAENTVILEQCWSCIWEQINENGFCFWLLSVSKAKVGIGPVTLHKLLGYANINGTCGLEVNSRQNTFIYRSAPTDDFFLLFSGCITEISYFLTTNSYQNTVMLVAWVGLHPCIVCRIRFESKNTTLLRGTGRFKRANEVLKSRGACRASLSGLGRRCRRGPGGACGGPCSPPAGAAGNGSPASHSSPGSSVQSRTALTGNNVNYTVISRYRKPTGVFKTDTK